MNIQDKDFSKAAPKYQDVAEVDELDPKGEPTGKKLAIRNVPLPLEVCQEREAWLAAKLEALKSDPNVHQVKVLRGSYDDVIGIEVT
jgi:hypothetical protein